jgi:kynurenine 3-monooxygenase
MSNKIVIIGAGMAGCFMAVCLAKRGYDVQIYEHRPDVRKQPYDSGRSFNLTLYYRGIQAMKRVDIWDDVKKIAIIAEGNAAHYGIDKVVYSPFDARGDEILYTVHRNQLNGALLNVAEKFENIKITFNTKCVGIDKKHKKVHLEKDGKEFLEEAEIVIGADGVHSLIRSELESDKKDAAIKEYEDWGYKEVHISPELTQQMNLRTKATHTWPRENSLLIAFPNPDNSFTLMFNLPLEGKDSFSQLQTKETIETFIIQEFPDLKPLLPHIVHSFLNKPTGTFVTLYAEKWYDKDFMAVIGDAAHAVIPFYGQGVCAAFEDALAIDKLIDVYTGDWQTIFEKYQENRKVNTDLLAQLSKDNFIELRDKSRSPYYILKDKTDTFLHHIFPNHWLPPLYVLIAHGNLEYKEALARHARQEKIAKRTGLNLALQTMSLPWAALNRFKQN